MAKDFSNLNFGNVYGNVTQATSKKGQQGTVTAEEKGSRENSLKTQGRKGCKAVRINMAFTTDNHTFIKVMAKAAGMTMTEYTNAIIAAYRKEHPELMEQAEQFIIYAQNVAEKLKNEEEDGKE